MRRKDKQMSTEEALEILCKGQVGILSTVSESQQPYGVPVNYASDSEFIYVHCALEGKKTDNILANKKVCFTVCGDYKIIPETFTASFQSVIVFGIAEMVEKEEKIDALRLLIEKYSPDYIPEGLAYIDRDKNITAVIKIQIEELTGKRSI